MMFDSLTGRLRLLFALLAVLYGGFFAFSFLEDPLGLSPVLDARENITWAQRIAQDQLPNEPFYRALLYPLLLSLVGALPAVATVFGLCFHWLNAILVGLITWRFWQSHRGAWLAGLLYAVYPVALYFSVQVLDITFALSFFLLGFYSILCALGERRCSYWVALLAGLLGGLAVLARPNFLPAVLCFPLLPLLAYFSEQGKDVAEKKGAERKRWGLHCVMVAVGLLLVLLVQGVINHRLSGAFRILPWQGSYNLYAANRDGANGKFYEQQVSFDQIAAGSNTTRMESEYLYREAFGGDADLEIDAMGAYWKSLLWEEVQADPIRWLSLMGRKVAYLFNDWEQYNNLSYAYHKERFALLSWNPLGWGVLLLAAFSGLVLAWRKSARPVLYGGILLCLAYTAGLLLFFVAARFRLPLVPFLCVGAGGLAFFTENFYGKRVQWILGGCTALAVLSFGNWWGAQDRTTFIQDEILLANASSRIGDDFTALDLADAALLRDPTRAEAQRIRLASLFNIWMRTDLPGHWARLGLALDAVDRPDAATEFIRGVYLWRSAELDQAVATWETAIQKYGIEAYSSVLALEAIGLLTSSVGGESSLEELKALLNR